MPSQSLTIRFANAVVLEPNVIALRALREVAGLCRHAGVKKKLDRLKKAAQTALISRPERLLDIQMDGPVPKDMALPFRDAVQTLLAEPEPMTLDLWLDRFGPGRAAGWRLAQSLIWEVTGAAGLTPFTALPRQKDAQVHWTRPDGSDREAHADDLVRLWHPVESPHDLGRLWRLELERLGLNQPFAQAGRETYRPATTEMAGSSSACFEGRSVSATPLVGLARTTGWRLGYNDEVRLTLSGVRFTLNTGLPGVYPGSGGQGVVRMFHLNGPQTRFDQVPARILSEVLRRADLLVSVGERG
jgi:hypothetical protein